MPPNPKQRNIALIERMAIIPLLLSLLSLTSCNSSGHDSDYIPYGLKGMDVLVYNNTNNDVHFAGRVEGTYASKDKTISECQSQAYAFANQNHLQNWSYICCTVTSSSSCATKVR